LTYQDAKQEIQRNPDEGDQEYAARITNVISQSLAHIHWAKEQDTTRYHQLVPIWENYFIYFMGKFSGIPEYEKYHFANYDRSIERGIGICGDASMIMSQLLDKQGIKNQLLSFPGHVVLSATMPDKNEYIFDPDFGVALPYTVQQVNSSPKLIEPFYQQAGYTTKDAQTISRSLGGEFERWNGVTHFITKKYYFEKVAYWLKWPLPLIMIAIGIFFIRRKKTTG
jgi:hypothetical protein